MFGSKKSSASPPSSLDPSLLGMMVEDTPDARKLVAKCQSDLLQYRSEMDGGMVAAGTKAGIAMSDDGGLVLFDKYGVHRVPASAVVQVSANDDKYVHRSVNVLYDISAVGESRKSQIGGFDVDFATDEGFKAATETLRAWWNLFHPGG